MASFVGLEDNRAETRRNALIIRVDTLNPNEPLNRFNAPPYIHYMSLDTEGCGFEILEAIQLDEFKIATMTIEHNHEPTKRDKIRIFLANRGYPCAANKNDDFFFHGSTSNTSPAASRTPFSIRARRPTRSSKRIE